MSELEQHHIKYKEIHGVDEIVMLTPSEHKELHRRLRREGKCNVPADELAKISHRAHRRSPRSKAWVAKFEKSLKGKKISARYEESQKGKAQRAKYREANHDELNRRARETYAKRKQEVELNGRRM